MTAEPGRVLKCHTAMPLAVGITGKLRRSAEVEIRLPRIVERPAAIAAFKIEERFRFVASTRSGHDLART
jgi:hypothetical protein